ncbi:dihydrolipoyl dehydrogenase [Albimonas pacifica]|uniref:Dihydrolipoyl dehydrogenase n=1 Tax=Albimonas pacifica TaxID=1114924 RepID=A0A1I3NB61_9RHOB|nr:dihydrolipoyl dehydrogenase [Albimonas pacifica]SFJ06581.1 dihydrolipoamide dehydrogenase [Albimonas pacifica]
MTDLTCALLVIGGGPGGYVCASRAARLGVDVMLVEAGPLGGTCLNIGCIPSKALIHVAETFHAAREQARGGRHGVHVAEPRLEFAESREWMGSVVSRLRSGVGGLMEKSGVKTLQGRARFLDGKTVEVEGETGARRIRAEQIVIATGARPTELPGLPFGGKVLDSAGALALPEPPERLAVVGAGYIGLEIGTAFAKLGSAVTVVEAAEAILPAWDERLTRPVRRRLEALGVSLRLGARVTGCDPFEGRLEIAAGETTETLEADAILVAAGRTPMTDGLGLEELSLRRQGPFIEIDDRCRTSMRGVYAIGDVTPGPMLAHRAMAQGELAAEVAAGRAAAWDRVAIPAVCFTDPEIAAVGLSPEEARARGEAQVAEFSLRANGRALTLDAAEGFVRLVARASDRVLLGAQIVGPGASETIPELALAIEAGLRLDDLAATIHAHPTLAEAVQEAALSAVSFANHG